MKFYGIHIPRYQHWLQDGPRVQTAADLEDLERTHLDLKNLYQRKFQIGFIV